MTSRRFLLVLLFSFLFGASSFGAEKIVVGSKKFPESYILAEIMAQLLESEGYKVERKLGFGGVIAYQALASGDIHVYPEYTGTVALAILKSESDITFDALNARLSQRDLRLLKSFGFNNTYAIAVNKRVAQQNGLTRISDMKGKKLKGALYHEFLSRKDGWGQLSKAYGLQDLEVEGIEHSLSYEAVDSGKADFMDVYSTDAKISKFDLTILEDDKAFFPKYFAAPFVREELPLKAIKILEKLAGRIDEGRMIKMNSRAVVDKVSFGRIAEDFLIEEGFKESSEVTSRTSLQEILHYLLQHLYLTFVPILMAVIVAIPLAILLLKVNAIAQPVMTLVGLLQTIPSLALLVFMIPYFGTGVLPALVALFLYSILPILRNTYVALKNIDPVVLDAARGIGLFKFEILFLVQIPLALPVIIAGIRTAAVMNIGLATIAAFIGAGGLGEPIVTGLTLNDTDMVLRGAIPAAILAVVTEILFERIEKAVKP